MFIVALFTITKKAKQTNKQNKCPPSGKWINKNGHTMEYYLDTKSNEVLTHATT